MIEIYIGAMFTLPFLVVWVDMVIEGSVTDKTLQKLIEQAYELMSCYYSIYIEAYRKRIVKTTINLTIISSKL